MPFDYCSIQLSFWCHQHTLSPFPIFYCALPGPQKAPQKEGRVFDAVDLLAYEQGCVLLSRILQRAKVRALKHQVSCMGFLVSHSFSTPFSCPSAKFYTFWMYRIHKHFTRLSLRTTPRSRVNVQHRGLVVIRGDMEIETTPDPASLWASDDPAVWRSVLARYPECVETAAGSSKSKAALVELDRCGEGAL